MGRGVGQANDYNKKKVGISLVVSYIVSLTHLFQQAFNEPDVYETGDLPEDDQAQFESVSDVRRLCCDWTCQVADCCLDYCAAHQAELTQLAS